MRVEDSDALLTPELLCQVKFLAPEETSEETAGEGAARSRILVPARLVLPGDEIWVVNAADGTAERRTVELGARRGDWVEVRSGVNLSDKLIDQGRERLEEGDRLETGGGK